MTEHSFKRAALFGVLGALVAFLVGKILVQFAPGLKGSVLFETERIDLDLYLIGIQLRINLFVVAGFIAGWAFFLFRRSRRD